MSKNTTINDNTKKKTKGELYLERLDMEERDPNIRPEVSDSSSESEIDFAEVFKPHERRFKYVGFRERINNVDINVFLPATKGIAAANERKELVSVRQQGAALPEGVTFFSEALHRWRDYDTSTHYAAAYAELAGLCQTLPIELLNRDRIVDALLRRLALRTPSYPAFLNLLAHLSRDLRSEFYPRLQDVLDFLVRDLLDPREPELLEAVFTTVSYFFKFLQRQLVDDIDKVVDWYSTLVGHWKEYIRTFAAESAAFLLRKVAPERLPAVVARVVALVEAQATEHAADGVAALLFETVRGSRNEFHSVAPAVLKAAFAQLAFNEAGESDEVTKLKFLAMWRLAKRMQRHVKNARNPLLWPIVVAEVRSSTDFIVATKKGDKGTTATAPAMSEDVRERALLYHGERAALFMSIMSEWIAYHNGAIVPPREMAGHVISVLRAVFVPEIDGATGKNCHLQALRLLENLFLLAKLAEEEEEEDDEKNGNSRGMSAAASIAMTMGFGRRAGAAAAAASRIEYGAVSSVVGLALNPPRTAEAIFTFCMTRKQRDETTFYKYVFSNLAAYLSRNATQENYPAIIAFAEQLVAGDPKKTPVAPATVSAENAALAKIIVPIIVKIVSATEGVNNKLLWAAYRTVPGFVPVLSASDAATICACAMKGIQGHLAGKKKEEEDVKNGVRYHRQTAYEAFNAISNLLAAGKAEGLEGGALRDLFLGLVRVFRTIPAFLRVGHDFLERNSARICGKGAKGSTEELFKELMGIVTENFYSKNRDLRLESLRVLEPVAPSPAAAEALGWCIVVESTPLEVATIRDFTVNLEFVERKVRAGTFPQEVFPIIVPFILGSFNIKFSPVWPFSKTALLTLFRKHCAETWPCFIKQLEASENELLAFWNTSADSASAAEFTDAAINANIEEEEEDVNMKENKENGEEEEEEGGEEEEEEEEEPSYKKVRETADTYIPESIMWRRERESIGYKGIDDLYEDAKEANEYEIPPYTDIFTYNGMLWDVLETVSDVIEKENRSEKIVTFFMNFAQQNKLSVFRFLRDKSYLIDSAPGAGGDIVFDDEGDEGDEKKSVDELFKAAAQRRKPTAEQMAKMSCFLRVFARMSNPGAVYRSADLLDIFTRMLEVPSPKMQKQALACLITWRGGKLRPYRGHLMRMMREITYRDELARFQINDPKVVDPAHRHLVADTLTHLLWPFLMRRVKKRGKGVSLRPPTLAYLSTFNDEDLPLVMNRILEPIEQFVAGKSDIRSPLRNLKILFDILENINCRAAPFFSRIFDCVVFLLGKCETVGVGMNAASEAEGDSEGKESKKRAKKANDGGDDDGDGEMEEEEEEEEGTIEGETEEERTRRHNRFTYSADMRSCCIKIIDKFVVVFPEEFRSEKAENAGRLTQIVDILGGFIAKTLGYSKSRAPPGLFNVFLSMSCSEHTLPFVAHNPAVFPEMVSYAMSTKDADRSRALSFIENVLELAPTSQVASGLLAANASAVIRSLKTLFIERHRHKSSESSSNLQGGSSSSCPAPLRALRQRAIKIFAAVGVRNAQNVTNSELNEVTMRLLDFVLTVQNDEARDATISADAKQANEEMTMSFMTIVDQIFEAAHPTRAVVLRVASLLQRQQNRKLRTCISAVFAKIAAAISGFEEMGRFVADISAYNIKNLSSIYDYDARQRAFNIILDNETTGFLTRMRSHLEYYIVYSVLIHNAYDADSTMRENALATLEIFFATLERKYGQDLSMTAAVDSGVNEDEKEAASSKRLVITTSKPKEIRKLVVKDIFGSVRAVLMQSFKENNYVVFSTSFNIFRMLGAHFPKIFHDFAVLSTPIYDETPKAVVEVEDNEEEVIAQSDNDGNAEVKEEVKEEEEEEEETEVKKEIKEEEEEEVNVKKEVKEEEEEEGENKDEDGDEKMVDGEEEKKKEEEEEEKTVLFGKCFIPHFADFSFESKVKALEHFCAVLQKEREAGRKLRRILVLWLPIFLKIAENHDTLFKAESSAFLNALGNAIAEVHDDLDWPAYYSSVMGVIKTAKKLAEEKKSVSNILVSIICKVLEKFHFAVASKEEVDKEERGKGKAGKKKMGMSKDVDMASDEYDEYDDEGEYDDEDYNGGDGDDDDDDGEKEDEGYDEQFMLIQRSLKLEEISANLTLAVQANLAITQQFVPILMNKLTEEKNVDIGPRRMALARAIIRLLLLLPNREGDTQITQLIIVLCQTLQSKDDAELREGARTALCDVTARLGPTYFEDVVRELRFALKRGFQLHVLGYTMNKVLGSIYAETERLYKAGTPCDQGVFDAVIPGVVDVLFEDLIGTTGRQKDIRELAKGKKQNAEDGKVVTVVEVGKSTAYQSFRILAALARFDTSEAGFGGVGALIRPIVERIRNNDIANDVKRLNVFVNVLKHVVMGLSHNRTTTTKVILEFSYVLIKNNILPSEKERKAAEAAARLRMTPEELEEERRKNSPRYIAMQEAKKKFLVFKNLSQTKKKIANGATSNAYVIANFGFSLLEAAVRKLSKRLFSIDQAQERGDMEEVTEEALGNAMEGVKDVTMDGGDSNENETATPAQKTIKKKAKKIIMMEEKVIGKDGKEEEKKEEDDAAMNVEEEEGDSNENKNKKKAASPNAVSKYVDSRTIIALLDPFVPILVKCLNDNQQASVIQSAISVLSVLVPHKSLPSIPSNGVKIVNKAAAIIRLGAASSAGLVCSCLRLLSALFTRGYYQDVKEDVLTELIEYAARQLTEADEKYGGSHPDADFLLAVLGFLQTVVSQRLVTPQVYDMVDTAARLSIISPVAEVRGICSRVAVAFFEAYPATDVRKGQVVDFFVKNVEYASPVGRRSALETVDALFRSVSGANSDQRAEDRKLIAGRLEVIYLTLINRFINETEIDLKTYILRSVIHSFVAAFAGDETQLDVLLTLTFDLLRNSKKVLIKQAVLQLTGVFVDVAPKRFTKRYTAAALPYIGEVVGAAAALTTKTLDDLALKEAALHSLITFKHVDTAADQKLNSELPSFKDWEIVYHALNSLERVISANHAYAFAPELRGIWDNVVTLLAYNHSWVQLVCLRLIYGVLNRLEPRKLAEMVVLESGRKTVKKEGSAGAAAAAAAGKSPVFVLDVDFLYAVAVRLIGHIGGDFTTDASMSCSLKLLVALTNVLALCNNNAVPASVASDPELAATKDHKGKDKKKKKKQKKGGKKKEEGEEEEKEKSGNDKPKNFSTLYVLLKRFSKLTEMVTSPKRCLIYKWFAALILILTKSKKLKVGEANEALLSSAEKTLKYITKPENEEEEIGDDEEGEGEGEEAEETLMEEGMEFVTKSTTIIMFPLYRSSTDAETVTRNEKSISKGTLKVLRDVIGDKAYFGAYNAVRGEAAKKAELEEQAMKRLAIVDPRLNSKRKLEKEKKRTNPAKADEEKLLKKLSRRGVLLKVSAEKNRRDFLKSDTTPMAKPRRPTKK